MSDVIGFHRQGQEKYTIEKKQFNFNLRPRFLGHLVYNNNKRDLI